ncbi:D-alanyl-D-alanine carboxypeptidase/D-alanyl-D-alanine endopeptidase [Solihabitans fulvus]|uniref:D-alanyl-D-alanine carboxypeptidase/D-alanyl-D-alanine endopeptidase n=1 Tax=Solihabitans fulvus TaxID=1892852 RepID=UPI001CB767DA|nr:D-alanyl-D-alanine carboxypeptidase/D-alanyl-D-alanine-endopeptidase [Solihabitans fulvus]
MVVLALLFGLPSAALPGALLTGAVAEDGNPLGKDLDTILADPRLTGATVGLVVRNADTGSVLYTRNSAARQLPASNGKLLTSTAALELLGPDYTFGTSVLADGHRTGSTIGGNLYLRGTGDPTMLAKDYRDLAVRLAASGVRTVSGGLVADDTWFDSVRLGPGWSWDDEPFYYSAQTSALTVSPTTDYDAGSVIVRIRPGAVGRQAKVETDPPTDYLTIENGVTTGAAGSGTNVTVDRDHGTNTVRLTGSIGSDAAPDEEFVAVWNPTALVASFFRKALQDNGIRVVGGTSYRAAPAGATELAKHDSIPLRALLVPFMKLSNNMHAEILTKSAGRKESGVGSWDAGTRALAGKLAGLGVDPAALRMVDGSGLSRMDNVSPDQLAALLIAARGKPWFGPWYDSLPIAGVPDRLVGGTLRHRMTGTAAANNLRAKTGSMTGVTALSGYVTAADGEHLVFSFVQNDFLADSLKDVEDAVGVRLAEYRGPNDTSGHVRLPNQRAAAPPVSATPTVGRGASLECSWTKSC